MTIPDTELVKHITQTNATLETLAKQLNNIEQDVKELTNKFPYAVTQNGLKTALVDHVQLCTYKAKNERLWPASINGWLQIMVMLVTLLVLTYGGVTWFSKIDALAASGTQNDTVADQLNQVITRLNKLDHNPVGNPASVDSPK